MQTVFISGHIHTLEGEFEAHYVPQLEKALSDGCKFVVGDASGIDAMAQKWLKTRGADVTVYHMFTTPRHNAGFPTKGGYANDEERDCAMTNDSDQDLAWVRPGKEKSGTAANIARRQKNPNLHKYEV